MTELEIRNGEFMHSFMLAPLDAKENPYDTRTCREKVCDYARNYDSFLSHQEINMGVEVDRSAFFADMELKIFHRLTNRGVLKQFGSRPFMAATDCQTFSKMLGHLEVHFITMLETLYEVLWAFLDADAESSFSALKSSNNIPFDAEILTHKRPHYDYWTPLEKVDAESVTAFVTNVRETIIRLIPRMPWLSDNVEWCEDARKCPIKAFYRPNAEKYGFDCIMPANAEIDRKLATTKEWQYIGVYIRCHHLECPWLIDCYALHGKTAAFKDIGIDNLTELSRVYYSNVAFLPRFHNDIGRYIEPLIRTNYGLDQKRWYECAYVCALALYYGVSKLDWTHIVAALDRGVMSVCREIILERFETLSVTLSEFGQLECVKNRNILKLFVKYVQGKCTIEGANATDKVYVERFDAWNAKLSNLIRKYYEHYDEQFS